MPKWFKDFLQRLVNKFVTWPTRKSIEETAKELENAQGILKDKQSNGNIEPPLAASRYCCVLYWDESTGRADEPITVSSVAICEQLAARYHAKYRRPILNRACS
jgi:hypothetical protein